LAISLTTACLLSPSAVMVVYDAVRHVVSVMGGRPITTPWWLLTANDISNTLVLLEKVLDFFLYCFTSDTFRRRLFALFARKQRKREKISITCCQKGRRTSSPVPGHGFNLTSNVRGNNYGWSNGVQLGQHANGSVKNADRMKYLKVPVSESSSSRLPGSHPVIMETIISADSDASEKM
jgi:hypothetical protein